MNVTTVGIDLAKLVFQVHGVDGHGKTVIRKQLKRAELMQFFANLPACLIGMEACSSAHHWARRLIELGHTVKLMAKLADFSVLVHAEPAIFRANRTVLQWPGDH